MSTDGQATGAGGSEGLTLPDLRIRTKDRRIIPFQPNAVQTAYLDTLLPGWEARPAGLRGVREILLKARQFGFSTLILALFYLDTITVPHTQTVVIAHDTESTERLFQTVQRFHRLLPEEKRPRPRYANRREFLFEDIDSYFFVGTAGSGDFGRGGTINNVHGSEVAFWPNADELVKGLLEAVPREGNVFLETTANGLGNWFEGEYRAAERGESVYTPRFFAWFEHDEYRLPVPGGFVRTAAEEQQATAYGLDDAQLAWRREKILTLRDQFPQEYPANPREAFLTSGNPYFNRPKLDAISALLESRDWDPLPVALPAACPLLTRNGGLSVWQEPVAGRRYVIGADTAEGLTDAGEADWDSADVLDAETWEQVAHLHGKWDTHEYGLMLAELGGWYNTALVAVERNNHGHAVLNAMLHAAHYPPAGKGGTGGVYFHEEYDETKRVETMRPGWPTTPRTKFFALDGLATALESGDLKVRSRQTVSELLTFVKLPGGKAGGEGKSHDDAVVSLAIANAMLMLRPRIREAEVY